MVVQRTGGGAHDKDIKRTQGHEASARASRRVLEVSIIGKGGGKRERTGMHGRAVMLQYVRSIVQ